MARAARRRSRQERGSLSTLAAAYAGRTVLLTGHTGFKGTWLALWLRRLGADVVGCALDPPTTPNLFAAADPTGWLTDVRADVRDRARLTEVVDAHRPDVVFHLAAVPLVREAHDDPVTTFAVNVLGTAHLLEALRLSSVAARVVVVTSDKCYRPGAHPHGEDDPLGGDDPYSASKAAQELVAAAYRASYFGAPGGVTLATARAGNVVGGGDWATDRLLPDAVRAFAAGSVLAVRNPTATRPWQHVLSPLAGYLLLGARLADAPTIPGAFNFGPDEPGAGEAGWPVQRVVEVAADEWGGDEREGGRWSGRPALGGAIEADRLELASDRARQVLGWQPVWGTETAIRRAVRWYRRSHDAGNAPAAMAEACNDDLDAFEQDARTLGKDWL